MYKYKSWQSIKIESLPHDAGAHRGWKNGLVTNCVTGQDIVLDWVLGSLDVAAHLEVSQCVALPRLGAYIAALLTEPKHLRGDLGVQFQAYIVRT